MDMNQNGAFLWNIRKIVSKGDYNYAVVPEHPKSNTFGYVLEHRVVVENHLGRLLHTNEVVHHINGNKKDNCIENLEVHDRREHTRSHSLLQGKSMINLMCPSCGVTFTREKRQTHLSKPYSWTACSKSCRGKFSRKIQLQGLTEEVQNAISVNILSEYKKYSEDNTEVTHLQEIP